MNINIVRFLSNGILTQIWKIVGWNFYPAIFPSYKVISKMAHLAWTMSKVKAVGVFF